MRRQGRLDAHRRPVQGHDGRERHRRRRSAPDLRCRADRQDLEDRRRRDRVRRRRRLQPGHHGREHEPRQGLEPARDLRVRGQRLRRIHGQLLGLRRRPGRARPGYGIPSRRVDGDDFFEVWDAAREAIERARNGEGPSVIHVKLDAPLRPLRGRRHDLSGRWRDRHPQGRPGLPQAVPPAGHRGRAARGRAARRDRPGGQAAGRRGPGRGQGGARRRPRPIS